MLIITVITTAAIPKSKIETRLKLLVNKANIQPAPILGSAKRNVSLMPRNTRKKFAISASVVLRTISIENTSAGMGICSAESLQHEYNTHYFAIARHKKHIFHIIVIHLLCTRHRYKVESVKSEVLDILHSRAFIGNHRSEIALRLQRHVMTWEGTQRPLCALCEINDNPTVCAVRDK